MNFGFFGVQFSFGLQQSNMSAIYKYLGAEESELPMLWLAGPVTGLIVQPIIGAISDGTWSVRFGRRKPFFLIGAVIASIALVSMPYSSTIWMAASLLWILDAANNIALEPYRAFISDKLDKKQHSIGFLMQSFFTGLGTTMANFTPALLVSFGILALSDKMENGIPVSTYWAFGIGAFASIATILVTVFTTSEYPPTQEELERIKEAKKLGNPVIRTLKDIGIAIKEMPLTMKQLIPVMSQPVGSVQTGTSPNQLLGPDSWVGPNRKTKTITGMSPNQLLVQNGSPRVFVWPPEAFRSPRGRQVGAKRPQKAFQKASGRS